MLAATSCQIRWVDYSTCQAAIRQIRDRVFIQEQQIDPELEFDGLDPHAQHALADYHHQAVGTLRLRAIAPETLKLERLAVLPPYRGQGIGRQLVQAAIAQAQHHHYHQIVLHSQQYIVPLYAQLGFQIQGEPFVEANIPHVKMTYEFKVQS
ncbi:MAG: GNAT family N-acetyltransferase [Cyanobacteria bacterium P01_G01_bin.54]